MKFLELKLQGVSIPIPEKFSMRLTWKSPATDFDKIPSGHGFGLTFPMNDHTRAIFNNPERFAKYRSGNDQKFPGFEVIVNGVLFMAGTLTVPVSAGGNYEASLSDEVGVLGENERERDILTFPAFTKDIPWVNSANYDPDVHYYCCFPIVNVKFFKEKGVTVPVPATANSEAYETEALSYAFMKSPVMARVNALEADGTVKCITTSFETSSKDVLPVISVVSPFFFLHKVITEALKSVDFHVVQNAFSTSEKLRRLCIYNNFDFTKNESVTTLVEEVNTMYPVDFHGLDQYVYPYASGYRISEYKRSYPETLKAKDHLPKINLGTLLLSTQNKVNICHHFLPNNTVNIFWREELISGPATDLNQYFLGIWDPGEKKDVALKFVQENDENDLIFAERFQDIEDRVTDMKDPVADWEALMAIGDAKEGDIRYVTASNNYMEFKMITIEEEGKEKKDILGWEEYSVGFQNGWYNRGKRPVEEIKTQWSTCYGNDQYTIVSQMGNMNSWKAKSQPFSPRLLIYKGNNQGGNESADFSLDYEKAGKGIIPTLWKNWARFWANRLPVTGRFDLPVNVLRHLIYNICNKYRTREGEFMIEEMSCDIYVDRIGETEIKGFKVE
ncbi:MAG TPA: hypothetical protein VFG54_12150 [Prolixibacteraceae bacterium]|nr:hypothetical protein [Prolixibacteraceae bacterium]